MPRYTPGPPPLSMPASVFVVVRYDRAAEDDERFQVLPNVECERYGFTEGAVVPSAQFRYVLDNADPSLRWPHLWEQLWPIDAKGPYTVRNDDELLVYEYLPDGSRLLVFDGFAAVPQVDQAGGLTVTFAAEGVHVRLWDTPVFGAIYRDASKPKDGADVRTGRPVWFNPAHAGKAHPNRTRDDYETSDGGSESYPVFLDERLPAGADADATHPTPDSWTLGDFVRHLCKVYNTARDAAGSLWVSNPVSPNGSSLDSYLRGANPKPGKQYMDLTKPETYDLAPIVIRSFDATNKSLPAALEEQLAYFGFKLFFNTREDPDDAGAPRNEMIVFRTDGRDAVKPKNLYYPPEGGSLADGLPTFHTAQLSRDSFSTANEYAVETRPVEYEVSLILAPGFPVDATDSLPSNLKSFDKAKVANGTAAKQAAYRHFVFDEAGLGHWDGSTFVTGTATSLDAVLGAPETVDDKPVPKYAVRLRPGDGPLFSKNDKGEPRDAELEISRTDPGVTAPGVYGGTGGAWQTLGTSGWKFLKDRLGVELTCDNPSSWRLPKGDSGATSGDVVDVITSLANPAGSSTKFWLKLTCVIESDAGVKAEALRRDASPKRFAVRRTIDAKDHYRKEVVHKSSKYNTTGADVVSRDDTAKATDYARALRLAAEFPSVGGGVMTPWVSHAIGVGDLIGRINGRKIDLRSNAGAESGEGPRYPAVIGFEVSCAHPQQTVLKLSDRRSEPEGVTHGFGHST